MLSTLIKDVYTLRSNSANLMIKVAYTLSLAFVILMLKDVYKLGSNAVNLMINYV